MTTKFKEWMDYRKNKRIAKRELTKLAATTLPSVNKVVDNYADTTKTIYNLVLSCQGLTGDELRSEFIGKIAALVHEQAENEREE